MASRHGRGLGRCSARSCSTVSVRLERESFGTAWIPARVRRDDKQNDSERLMVAFQQHARSRARHRQREGGNDGHPSGVASSLFRGYMQRQSVLRMVIMPPQHSLRSHTPAQTARVPSRCKARRRRESWPRRPTSTGGQWHLVWVFLVPIRPTKDSPDWSRPAPLRARPPQHPAREWGPRIPMRSGQRRWPRCHRLVKSQPLMLPSPTFSPE